MHTLATLTPDQAVTIGSGWITAAFTLLSLIFAACVGFWAKYGAMIQLILARLDRHGARLDTLQTNAAPPVPTVVVTPAPPQAP